MYYFFVLSMVRSCFKCGLNLDKGFLTFFKFRLVKKQVELFLLLLYHISGLVNFFVQVHFPQRY